MDQAVRRRATNLAEMAAVMGPMFSPEEVGAAIGGFRPRPTDVVITPFGKCGTTWLQQSFHCLRTRGDMDFDDISRVVPWIETAVPLGVDINAEQRAEPRGFKSHLAWDAVPKGAKYVVSLRDPKDAMVSMYRFFEGWFFEPGSISIEDFVASRMGGSPGSQDYWAHLVSWWGQRDNPDVLMFSYEQMIDEPERSTRRLAAFAGIPLDDELLALTLKHSSIDFMLTHKDRFDDFMMRRLSEERGGLPPGSDSAKVRKGGVGGRKELPEAVAAELDRRWAEVVEPATGFADYASLEAALRARS